MKAKLEKTEIAHDYVLTTDNTSTEPVYFTQVLLYEHLDTGFIRSLLCYPQAKHLPEFLGQIIKGDIIYTGVTSTPVRVE